MKCSICENEAIGFVAVADENFHGFMVAYEFRCKEHMKKFKIKRLSYCNDL